jgi:hypothetical protein
LGKKKKSQSLPKTLTKTKRTGEWLKR